MLPTFLIIGAMKSGTTSLYNYLAEHPQVSMAGIKEPEFFSDHWDRGLGWYGGLFNSSSEAVALGEASTGYTKFPSKRAVPERIASVIPDARLVYLVRDPVQRIRSHYEVLKLNGQEQRPPRDAITADSDYVVFSRYFFQLEQYLEYFDKERLLVVTAEELFDDTISTVKRVLTHIKVDPEWKSSVLKVKFNQTGETRTPRRIKTWISKVPGHRAIRAALPWWARERVSSLLNKRGSVRNSDWLTPDLERHVRGLLREDVESLRHSFGVRVGAWGTF